MIDDIRFLMAYYELGVLLTLKRSADKMERKAILERSLELISEFMGWLSTYELIPENIRPLTKPISQEVTDIRSVKINRLRQIKELKQQESLLADVPAANEELQRELYICRLCRCAIEATSHIESIRMELDILSMDPTSSPSNTSPRAPSQAPKSKISQPFILVNKREQLKDQVFRPGHSLPTMTIDEYLALESQRGGIIEKASNVKPVDEDDESVLEAQRLKDIRFDAFKDDNPRGWGNTHNLS